VILIEVIDRRGRVRERVRLERLPAFVGRAYTNDVVLEDRYASERHCALRETESGEIAIEDLGSVNGVKVLGKPDSFLLRSGDRFRIGETVLRMVAATHPVAPAEPLPVDEGGILHALRDSRIALAIVGGSLAAFTLDEYLARYYDTGFLSFASPALLGLGALGLWAGIWAFVNRLLTHRFDYLRHLSCACIAAAAYLLFETFAEYAEFIFSSGRLGFAISLLGGAATTYFLFSAHLTVIPASTGRLRRVWAAVGTSLLLGITSLLSYTGPEDQAAEVPVRVPLKSIGSSLVLRQTTEEFLESARSLREKVDEEAEEEGR
jgi:pSer/pThr/pTyr-binding forkhead associated (FHA) protein